MQKLFLTPISKVVLSGLIVSVGWCQSLSAGLINGLVLAQEGQPEIIDATQTNWNILNKAIVVLCLLAALAVVCKSTNRH